MAAFQGALCKMTRSVSWIALGFLAGLSLPGSLQAAEVWSASAGESRTVEVGSVSGSSQITWTASGALMIAALADLPGFIGTMSADLDGNLRSSQFGARRGLPLTIERTLSSSLDGAVVVGLEERFSQPNRDFVGFVDAQGQLLWTLPGAANSALHLPNEMLVLSSGSALRAVERDSGTLRWTRELSELVPSTHGSSVTVASTASYPLIAIFTPRISETRYGPPVILTLNPANGEKVHQWVVEDGLDFAYIRCRIQEIDGDLILPWGQSSTSAVMHVDRRQGSNGQLVWRKEFLDLKPFGSTCGSVANESAIAFTVHSGFDGGEFIGLDPATGNQRWRTPLPIFRSSELLDGGGSTILLAPEPWFGATEVPIQQYRASDGQLQWQQTLTLFGKPAVRINATAIEVAGAVGIDNVLHLAMWQLDSADGAITKQISPSLTARLALASDARLLNGVPYLLAAGLGEGQRGINLRRLDPIDGSEVWTRTLTLSSATDSISFASLLSGPNDQVLVLITYVPAALAGTEVVRRDLYSIDSAGTPIFHNAYDGPLSQGGIPLAHSNGEVSWSLTECLDLPACTTVDTNLLRLRADGTERFRVPVAAYAYSVVGESTLAISQDSQQLVFNNALGAELWRDSPQTYVSLNGPVAEFSDYFIYTRNRRYYPPNPNPYEVLDVLAVVPETGAVLWSDSPPGPPGSHTEFGIPLTLPGGQEILVATIAHVQLNPSDQLRTPLLVKYDAQSGQRLAHYAPEEGGSDRSWTLGGPIGTAGDSLWMRGTRYHDGWEDAEQPRHSVAAIDRNTLTVISDHQLARDFDRPVFDLGRFRPITVNTENRALVESRSTGPDGVVQSRIQAFRIDPDVLVDLKIDIAHAESVLTGLGPTRVIQVRLVNLGPNEAIDASVEALSRYGDAWSRLVSCELNGTGACPSMLGTDAPQLLSLGAGAEMLLGYEVSVRGYFPHRLSDPREILFVVDPPPGVGDLDLGDNVATAAVRLGGFSNGFE